MAWAVGILAFLVFLGLMIKSPGFRKVMLGLLALLVLAGGGIYAYRTMEDKRQLSAIDSSELELRDVELKYDYGYKFKAIAKNKSRLHAISSIGIEVTLYDCPVGDPVDWPKCETIGQDDAYIFTSIPSGQVRGLDDGLWFGDMPPIKRRFVWSYRVTWIRAS